MTEQRKWDERLTPAHGLRMTRGAHPAPRSCVSLSHSSALSSRPRADAWRLMTSGKRQDSWHTRALPSERWWPAQPWGCTWKRHAGLTTAGCALSPWRMTASFWASVSPYLKRDGANKPQGCWEASKRPGCGKERARVMARPATATAGGECWRHRPLGAVPARAARGTMAGRPYEPAVQNELSG